MPGGPGGPGGFNGPGGTDKPADFTTPQGAVEAFMNALKAQDLDRLSEATALRAQTEASAKSQDIFKRIYDGSLSQAQLDDLAKKLEGYQIAGENPPKSTGRVQVIVQKTGTGQSNTRIHRVVTVRHEKKGWGVLDISGPAEIKGFRMYQPRQTGTGGRR